MVELTFILGNFFSSIYTDGLGSPEKELDEDGGQVEPQDASGTGMGEGEGVADVSSQIDDEGQLLDASSKQSESRDGSKEDTGKNDEGIEMEQDFDGDTYSVSEASAEAESDNEDDVNLESTMGQTGEDCETVDEMAWDKDEDNNPADPVEKYEKGRPVKPKDENSLELGAKQDDSYCDDEQGPEGKGNAEVPEQDADTAGDDANDLEDTGMNKETEVTDPTGLDADDDNLNLKDMEIDEGEASDAMGEDCNDELGDMDEQDSQDKTDAGNEDIDTCSRDEDLVKDEHIEGHDNREKELEQQGLGDQLTQSMDYASSVTGSQVLETTQASKTESGAYVESVSTGNQPEQLGQDTEMTMPLPSRDGNVIGDDQIVSKSQEDVLPKGRSNPNPERSMGDALKKWKERVNIVPEFSMNKIDDPDEIDDETADQYRFVSDVEKSSSQAVGSATADQSNHNVKLEDSNLKEDTKSQAEDLDVSKLEKQCFERPREMRPCTLISNHEIQEGDQDMDVSDGAREDISPIVKDIQKDFSGDLVVLRDLYSGWSTSDIKSHSVRSEELRQVRQYISEMSHDVMQSATKLWGSYDRITGTLSQELAEQLRLVMEPTLASKLQGDYRTGKRINMKKVIPYIASHYRKDKIWLRRTRPNKRDYQVVVAIDDSRSMAENRCGQIAIEALITVCRAMSQLEVGQLAVARFGEKGNIQLLQDFHQPFTSEMGIKMLSSLTFKQDNSILDEPIVDLLKYLNSMLDGAVVDARLPSGQNPLQQLILIIADGRFHEKENLKRYVRDVVSRKRMVALLILDSLEESIMDMQSVSIEKERPLSVTKYLDAFPFPYYVILKNIEALPQTLSGLLRQWFELMQITDE